MHIIFVMAVFEYSCRDVPYVREIEPQYHTHTINTYLRTCVCLSIVQTPKTWSNKTMLFLLSLSVLWWLIYHQLSNQSITSNNSSWNKLHGSMPWLLLQYTTLHTYSYICWIDGWMAALTKHQKQQSKPGSGGNRKKSAAARPSVRCAFLTLLRIFLRLNLCLVWTPYDRDTKQTPAYLSSGLSVCLWNESV